MNVFVKLYRRFLFLEFSETSACQSVASDDAIEIDGLTLIHDFLTEREESSILEMIDNVEWVQSQSGRRKQVGSRFYQLLIIILKV